LSSSSLLETIRQTEQNYYRLASVHQDGGLAQLLRTYALQEDFENSRAGLVARIRQGLPRLAPEEVDLVNDAVFLLFAHMLDRQHLELELKLDQIRGLETKLHEEMGIGREKEREAGAMESPLLVESDPPRALYPLQRLRAWTRLYTIHQEPTPLLPLTTCEEVLGEITERLPSQLTALSDGPLSTTPVRYHVSMLPDPRPFPLEQILELRELLNREGVLHNWWESLTAAISRLQQETLAEEQWRDLQERLQKAAAEFNQLWPASDEPTRHLRLDSMQYPELQPDIAFSLTSGLQPPGPGGPISKGRNGITLLLSPSAPPPDVEL
jgi:hypothetical protein